MITQLLLAFLLGLIIGLERQYSGSPVGIRTHAILAGGACLFGLASTHVQGGAYYTTVVDPGRIAAQVVTGVGFICGGVIFKDKNRLRGLTTAVTLWVSAAIGISVAFSMDKIAIVTTLMVLICLRLNHIDWIKQIGKRKN